MNIDFHILHREVPSPFFDIAKKSLGSYPVQLIRCDGDMAECRTRAFTIGDKEYVSFCDDDDYVMNMDIVEKYLAEHKPNALYTNSDIIHGDGLFLKTFFPSDHQWDYDLLFAGKKQIHQLAVVKRDLAILAANKASEVLKKLNIETGFEFAFYFEVSNLTHWDYLPVSCYGWRLWSMDRQLHYQDKEEHLKVFNYYKKELS